MKFKYLNREHFENTRSWAINEIMNNKPEQAIRRAYNKGYKQALFDWCIWKDGIQKVNDLIEEINEIDKEK